MALAQLENGKWQIAPKKHLKSDIFLGCGQVDPVHP
jgi:hypothetical protein